MMMETGVHRAVRSPTTASLRLPLRLEPLRHIIKLQVIFDQVVPFDRTSDIVRHRVVQCVDDVTGFA